MVIAAGVLTGVLFAACGGSNGPTPVTPPPPSPPSGGGSPNLAPAIDAIAVSSERTEVDSEITLTATVKDVTQRGVVDGEALAAERRVRLFYAEDTPFTLLKDYRPPAGR